MDPSDIKSAISFLAAGNDFLVTSHINSDGDSIASSLSMLRILNKLGKRASVILQDVPEDHYDFLDGYECIETAGSPTTLRDRAVVLDCPSFARIGSARGHMSEDVALLNVDHHKDNALFGASNLVRDVSSTCELLYHLVVEMGISIDAALAELLYTGILYDTGGFRYSLTTSTTLEAAAALVRQGARLDLVADRLYNSSSLETVKLVGSAIDSLELSHGGRVATLHLSHEDMRRGDPEEAVDYGLRVKGVEVTVLLKEEKPKKYRVSLRSRHDIDVSAVAAVFGGGGHARASGCRLEGTGAEVRAALLEQIGKVLA
jgi:phosphoesterase RecJ-like protein